MTTQQSDEAFQAAILKSPDDDNLRFVYADWLEDQGDPRAEYLRLECHMARDDKVKVRMQELAEGFESEWLAAVTRRAIDLCGTGIDIGFECPETWEHLNRTDNKNVRFCTYCNESVYFCTTASEALDQAASGRCVCLCPSVIAVDGEALASLYVEGKTLREELLGGIW